MLPLLLAVFLLCVVPVLNAVFNDMTRWGFLMIGMLWILSRNRLWLIFHSRIALATGGLLLWPLVTLLWSLDPGLSLIKVGIFTVVVCTMFALGATWAFRSGKRSMDVFLPFAGIFVLLIFSSGLPTGVATGYGSLYEGAGNPNLTGFVAAACLPLVLVRLFTRGRTRRLLWWLALAFIGYIFLATLSRSSILVAGITALGALIGMGTKRRMLLTAGIPILAVVVMIALPNTVTSAANYIYSSVIMKGALDRPELDDSFLASRDIPFQEQLRAAKAGGIFGGGYGAQIEVGHFMLINDQAIYFEPGTYKREKANSALAIVEEQGVIGLVVTLLWWGAFFHMAVRLYRRIPPGDERLQMATLIAFLIGMIFNSMFEAWWVSPGSLESLIFWSVAGMVYGLGRRHGGAPAARQQPLGRGVTV